MPVRQPILATMVNMRLLFIGAIALLLCGCVLASDETPPNSAEAPASNPATPPNSKNAPNANPNSAAPPGAPTPSPPAPSFAPIALGSFNPAKHGIALPPNPKIMVIPVNDENTKEGMIDQWQASFIERRLHHAKSDHYDLVILEIDTWGGEVPACERINSLIAKCGVPVIAFVKEKAFSGGALISLGCKAIIMQPDSQIGGALAIHMGVDLGKDMRIKMDSSMAATVKILATSNSYPQAIAQGMVDSGIDVLETDDLTHRFMTDLEYDVLKVKPTIVKKWKTKGQILTLTAAEAVNTGLASGTAQDVDEVKVGMGAAPTTALYIADITSSEKAARFLSHPLWRVLFVILGLISLFIELKSPGHGAGYLGFALCLGVFFWLQMFVANAGIIELVLFGAGAMLVALEIFLFPGVGVLGFAGFVLLIASIVLSFLPEGISIGHVWSGEAQPWEADLLNKGLMWSAVTLLSIVTVVIVGLLKGATLPGLSRMALTAQVGGTVNSGRDAAAAAMPSGPRAALDALIGQSGTSETVLRPAGKVRLNGVTYEAVSEGGFLKPGVQVVVLRVSSNSLVVRETPA